MSMSFTKLFSSITESTVWCEPDPTRITWIAMLAMADSKGRVWASIPGLANRARVSVEQAEIAISTFMSPDKYSRTPDNDGRRIEPIDGGWRLLNYEKYREVRDAEATKESKRRYINDRRAKEREEKASGVEKEIYSRTPSNQAEEEADKSSSLRSEDKAPTARFDPKAHLMAKGIDDSLAADWITLRRAKKAPPTEAAISGIEREADKARITLADALSLCCQRGWAGFKAEWALQTPGGGQKSEKQRNMEASMRAIYGTPAPQTEKLIQGEIV
jgi:sRNA-binding protein